MGIWEAERHVLDLFNVMVTKPSQSIDDDFLVLTDNIIVDFKPTKMQETTIIGKYANLASQTFFSKEEREKAGIDALIQKQLMHYYEVYGHGTPGMFELKLNNEVMVMVNVVKGVTEAELGDMLRNLIYTNAPAKDAESIKCIIDAYMISYDVNKIANNELRTILFNPSTDKFEDGDDATRFIVYRTTDSSLLIKSREVLDGVSANASKIPVSFLERHVYVLSTVFNRHKNIILSLKNKDNRTVINKIARWSKKSHIPVRPNVAATFVVNALADPKWGRSVIDKIKVRDKLKFLNLLAVKKLQSENDVFTVRNGKMFLKTGRKVYEDVDIIAVEDIVLNSLKTDLAYLKDKNIVLDKDVDYGLPISMKQTVGRLPFGTTMQVDTLSMLSSGIYWENGGGAQDLDLSTVDVMGRRVGWGQRSGFANGDVKYSGDITDAAEGAMEFMSSYKGTYGLYVNVYSGTTPCKMEIVAGVTSGHSKNWIDKCIIREEHTLRSRQEIVGIVKNRIYKVFAGRIGNARVSNGDTSAFTAHGLAETWTVKRLLKAIDVGYAVEQNSDTPADYVLPYKDFSFDKLTALFEGDG